MKVYRYRWTLRPIEQPIFEPRLVPWSWRKETGRFNYGTACFDRKLTDQQINQSSLIFEGEEDFEDQP